MRFRARRSPGQMLQQPPVQNGQVSMAQVFPHLTAAAQAPAPSLVLGHVTLHLSGADCLAGGLAKNLVICTMAEGRTGCDIERSDRKVSIAVAERFFHPEEKTFLETAENPEEKQKRFIMLWVLKEAHIKLMGTTIGAVKETPSFSIRGNKITCQGNDLFYSLYEGGGYVMAAAFDRKEERDNLIIKNYNDVPVFTLTAVN